MKKQPPSLPLWFLRWFCHRDHIDELEGDLIEMFERDVSKSPKSARWKFTARVLLHCRREYIGIGRSRSVYPVDMINNYLKVGGRNLMKQKLYSAINTIGLSLGLLCFILIGMYVRHEVSYDTFYPGADKVYAVYQRQEGNLFMGTDHFAVTPARLASILIEEIPDVASATTMEFGTSLLGIEDHFFFEEGLWADSNYFNVFDLPVLRGSRSTALTDPASVVLSSSLAKKIFDTDDVVGKELLLDSKSPVIVTAVIADLPETSSYRFTFITSVSRLYWYVSDMSKAKWKGNNFQTYIRMTDIGSTAVVESKFPSIIERNRDPKSYASYPFKDSYYLQPLTDVHLQQPVNMYRGVVGNRQSLYLFGLVAVLILVIACVNYMNLAIARSINRAREVGIRKAAGALKGQLVVQFLSESIVIAMLSLIAAGALVYLLLPLFGSLVDRRLTFDLVADPFGVSALVGLVLFVGIVSGSYPALLLSSLKPVNVLKGAYSGRRGFDLQRGLVVMQYAVSFALIVGSIVVYQQLHYIQVKDPGYDREHVLVIGLRDQELFKNYERMRTEWLTNPNVTAVTSSIHLPINMHSSTNINDDDDIAENDFNNIYDYRANYDVLEVFGLELVAGRDFSRDVKSDLEEGFILNETAARALGWTPAEAIGKQFTFEGTETVIGVVRDFHQHSMHLDIQPLMIRLYPEYANVISLKINPGDIQGTIAFLERTVRKYSSYPFDYNFLDNEFDELYRTDTRMGELFGLFTLVTILIASLGLFGLGAFMVAQRTREIGIRKALGATIQSVVVLLSGKFLVLVLIAFLLAVPVSWIAMRQWLETFAYRIDLSWWMFALAGIVGVLLAIMAVSYQSIKASVANPVDSLKYE